LSARAPVVSGGAMLLRPMACIRERAALLRRSRAACCERRAAPLLALPSRAQATLRSSRWHPAPSRAAPAATRWVCAGHRIPSPVRAPARRRARRPDAPAAPRATLCRVTPPPRRRPDD
jgi:hypothetical protein